jgi:hypothetical protein
VFYRVLVDENYNLYPKNDENGPKSRLYDVIMTLKLFFYKAFFCEKFRNKISNMIGYLIFFSFEVKRVKICENHNLYPKNDVNGPKSRLYDVIMMSKSLFFKKQFLGKN